jgi:hypothetical protein
VPEPLARAALGPQTYGHGPQPLPPGTRTLLCRSCGAAPTSVPTVLVRFFVLVVLVIISTFSWGRGRGMRR